MSPALCLHFQLLYLSNAILDFLVSFGHSFARK